MKRWFISLAILLGLGGILVGGWWWARTWPQQAVEFLQGGGLQADRAQDFVDWLADSVEREAVDYLAASGSIEGEEVRVVSEFGGRIEAVLVDVGDEVQAGDVLVELDTSLLRAQLAEAQAIALAARANLESVRAGAHPAEILASEAAVGQAVAEQLAAETAWQDALAILENPQQINRQITEARAAADLALVEVEQAQARIAAAAGERDRYRAQGSMEEKWLYAIHNYQVAAEEAALAAAQQDYSGKKEMLAALLALRDNPVTISSQVHLAEAQVQIAKRGVDVAHARLNELQAGPSREELAVAKAQVGQAEAAAQALDTQIGLMVLRSPSPGTVTNRAVHTGESALAGAVLLTIANLDEVTLTVYVPEDELNKVYLGQQVQVQVDSYPNRPFAGRVVFISDQAEFTPRNVQTEKERVNMVFAVRLRLSNSERLLKPGMPADAMFGH